MIVFLAIVGALTLGLLAGLLWRGFVMVGDRRQLGILTAQLNTEHRMSMATNAAIAEMRRIARAAVRGQGQARE